jgi:hypothetical protein
METTEFPEPVERHVLDPPSAQKCARPASVPGSGSARPRVGSISDTRTSFCSNRASGHPLGRWPRALSGCSRLNPETVLELYEAAARVDVGRHEHERARGRSNRMRRPRGAREDARARRAAARERWQQAKADRLLIQLLRLRGRL